MIYDLILRDIVTTYQIIIPTSQSILINHVFIYLLLYLSSPLTSHLNVLLAHDLSQSSGSFILIAWMFMDLFQQ